MAYFDDGTLAIYGAYWNFDVGRFFRAIEKANRKAETQLRKPQPEHLGKVGICMLPQNFIDFFLV
jgi:hypothetical protein